jgi:hypothetical protein
VHVFRALARPLGTQFAHRCNLGSAAAARVDPSLNLACVRACLNAQLCCEPVSVLVHVAFVDPDCDACVLGEQVAAAGGELRKLGNRSCPG